MLLVFRPTFPAVQDRANKRKRKSMEIASNPISPTPNVDLLRAFNATALRDAEIAPATTDSGSLANSIDTAPQPTVVVAIATPPNAPPLASSDNGAVNLGLTASTLKTSDPAIGMNWNDWVSQGSALDLRAAELKTNNPNSHVGTFLSATLTPAELVLAASGVVLAPGRAYEGYEAVASAVLEHSMSPAYTEQFFGQLGSKGMTYLLNASSIQPNASLYDVSNPDAVRQVNMQAHFANVLDGMRTNGTFNAGDMYKMAAHALTVNEKTRNTSGPFQIPFEADYARGGSLANLDRFFATSGKEELATLWNEGLFAAVNDAIQPEFNPVAGTADLAVISSEQKLERLQGTLTRESYEIATQAQLKPIHPDATINLGRDIQVNDANQRQRGRVQVGPNAGLAEDKRNLLNIDLNATYVKFKNEITTAQQKVMAAVGASGVALYFSPDKRTAGIGAIMGTWAAHADVRVKIKNYVADVNAKLSTAGLASNFSEAQIFDSSVRSFTNIDWRY
jgi:hypothetical protein